MYRPANGMMIVGKSGASSGKAEEEGHAGAMVDDDNDARGVIWLARSHGYLLDGTLAVINVMKHETIQK
jgi:hypothetical protein